MLIIKINLFFFSDFQTISGVLLRADVFFLEKGSLYQMSLGYSAQDRLGGECVYRLDFKRVQIMLLVLLVIFLMCCISLILQLVELSKAQDVEAGDGTTSVVAIAGTLLDAASKLLSKGMYRYCTQGYLGIQER